MERPRLYKVLLHNDDYTTREFVVDLLRLVFHKDDAQAVQIMLHVHRQGIGVAGLYPREVAETKVVMATHMAREHNFPLRLTLEAQED
ncbi:MAG: ATP-dependent Clp protease adaptor ClpS [Polyangiales bacterium]